MWVQMSVFGALHPFGLAIPASGRRPDAEVKVGLRSRSSQDRECQRIISLCYVVADDFVDERKPASLSRPIARPANHRNLRYSLLPVHPSEWLLSTCAATTRRFPVGARPTRRIAAIVLMVLIIGQRWMYASTQRQPAQHPVPPPDRGGRTLIPVERSPFGDR
jgi:hypothetical protein